MDSSHFFQLFLVIFREEKCTMLSYARSGV